jgi:hypothetical protein
MSPICHLRLIFNFWKFYQHIYYKLKAGQPYYTGMALAIRKGARTAQRSTVAPITACPRPVAASPRAVARQIIDTRVDDGPLSVDVWLMLLELANDFRTVATLACVCMASLAAVKKLKCFTFGSVRLSPQQAEAVKRILEMPQPDADGSRVVFNFNAYMSFGKTITAYAVALSENPCNIGHLYVGIVLPKAYDTWIKEWIKVSGVKASAIGPETRVLFPHSSVPAHAAHLKKIVEKYYNREFNGTNEIRKAIGSKVRLIIVSSTAKKPWEAIHIWEPDRIIVDEAHTVSPKNDAPVRWFLRLSAAPLSNEDEWGALTIAPTQAKGLVPEIDLKVVGIRPVPSASMFASFDEAKSFVQGFHKSQLIRHNLTDYIKAIRRVLSALDRGNVAIFLPDGDAGELLEPEIRKCAIDWDIFVYKHSVAVFNAFTSKKRSILFIGLNMSEAISVLASELVIVRPDWVNPQRYSQIVGRILRLTNHNPVVRATVIVPEGVPKLRARYYEALRLLAREDDYAADATTYRAAEYLKADSVLRALGSSMEAASPVEVLAAMGVGLEHPDGASALLKAWKSNTQKSLREEAVRTLLDANSI